MNLIKTAIVILNWNGLHFLKEFLPAIVKSTQGLNSEVIIADNHSTDGSVEWLRETFAQIRLIVFNENYGFTGGYNRALQQIDAEYFLLLNSDIEITNNWLHPLVEYMDTNQDVGACCPKVLAYSNKTNFEHAGASGGFIDRFGYPFCRGRILNSVEEDKGQYNNITNIFWATGAALMVRSYLFKQSGGLNEMFFAHMEEIDLCWRLQRMGYKISCVPGSVIYHVGGGALSYTSPRKLFLNYRNNLLMLLNNLKGINLFYTLFVRILLDVLSGTIYLCKGEFKNFSVVIKAHFSFYSKIPEAVKQKKQFLTLDKNAIPKGIYKQSIVLKYYTTKNLKFSDIENKDTYWI